MIPQTIGRRVRILCCGVWLAARCASSTAAPAAVDIIRAEFGIFDVSNPREMTFMPTHIIPQRIGQRYGWVITLRTGQRSLSVSEEYLLAPKAESANTPVNPDGELVRLERRNQVSQRQLVPVDGQIFGEWEIGPSDPTGPRHLQVLIEGEVVASFKYEVRALARQPGSLSNEK